MKNIKVDFQEWSVPIALLILSILSFGLLIPTLGFYWDDWEGILVSDQFPLSEFWLYFKGNRPLAAWTHIVLTHILGVKPLNWHIYTLIIRWLTVCLMWVSLAKIFSAHKKLLTFSAFLFTIYPIFIQQPISVAYHQHWTAFALYFVSILTMILALQKKKYYWIFTAISLISLFLDLSILEYTLGLELLRPFFIWRICKEKENKKNKLAGIVILKWLPYLLLFGGLLYWRFSYTLQTSIDPNRPTLLLGLLSSPIKTVIDLAQMIVQDMVFIFVSSWYKTLSPNLIQLRQPFNILSWALTILVALLCFYYLYNLKFKTDETATNDKASNTQILLTGILASLFGSLPIWSTYRQASGEGMFVDRFAMVSMFGASIVIVYFLLWLIRDKKKSLLILVILVGISSGMHLRNSNDYRWSWIKQKRIYWQLYWRAPYIEPKTSIMSFEQLVPFVSPTFSFNLIYGQPDGNQTFPYWYFPLDQFQNDLNGIVDGKPIEASHREFNYSAFSKDTLIVMYEPPFTNCLWVLDKENIDEPYLAELTKQSLSISNFDRIKPKAEFANLPSKHIFGKEDQDNWCYFYEKAELAKQNSDWDTIIELGNAAIETGYSPQSLESNSPHEWKPFIEGFAYTDDIEKAKELTIESYNTDHNYDVSLCNLWIKISNNRSDNTQVVNAAQEIFSIIGCNP